MLMLRASTLLHLAGLVDDRWFTPESRERGTTVHLIARQVFTGRPVDVAPEYEGYAKALRDGYAALGLQPICVEQRLSMDGLTGRPDLVGWLPNHIGSGIHAGPAIPDVKSGDPYPVHGVQLALYERLAEAEGLRRHLPPSMRNLPWQRIGFYVREDGTYRLRPYTESEDRIIADLILDLTRWRVAHGALTLPTETFDDDAVISGDDHDHDGPDTGDRPGLAGPAAVPTAGA